MKTSEAIGDSPINDWHGCYGDRWAGDIVPEAFAHPAKMSKALVFKIVSHCMEQGWLSPGDSVLDPFGGVGTTALACLLRGVNVVTCELEQKFVDLQSRNAALWERSYGGLPAFRSARWTRLAGDSRRLGTMMEDGGLKMAVSSPPYIEAPGHDTGHPRLDKKEDDRRKKEGCARRNGYGKADGQLSEMREGDVDLALSSPPYADSVNSSKSGIDWDKAARPERWGKSETRNGCQADGKHQMKYGESDGQLGAMKDEGLDAAIASPPYAAIATGAGGLNTKPARKPGQQCGRSGNSSSQDTDQRYGQSRGQLATMADSGFNAAIGSPPFEQSNLTTDSKFLEQRAKTHRNGSRFQPDIGSYGETENQLGNSSGDTFWLAAREIVEQVFLLLKPGGHAVWVTKNFVRKRQVVDFNGNWQRLCEAVGFVTVCRHRAMLVEHRGEQGLLNAECGVRSAEFQTIKRSRKSFFRRLAESKGSPPIDFEMVICMRKPMEGRPI